MSTNEGEWTGSAYSPSENDMRVYRHVQAAHPSNAQQTWSALVDGYAYVLGESVTAETSDWFHIAVPDILSADNFDEVRQAVMTHGSLHRSIRVSFPMPARPDLAVFSCTECSWVIEGLYRRPALEADPELEAILL